MHRPTDPRAVDPIAAPPPPREGRGRRDRPGGLGWALAPAAVAGVSAAATLARDLLQVPDVEMLFLLGVVITALVAGRGPSLLAAALAVLAYDYLFVPPPHTLDVADARYLLTFAMMFGVSVVVGTLTLRLRDERRLAEERERRTAALYALTHALEGAAGPGAVAAAVAHAASEALGVPAVLLERRGDALAALAAAPPGAALTDSERAVAAWVVERGWAAGRGAEAFSNETVLCVPVRAWGEAVGVLAARTGARDPGPEQRLLLEALARQGALALDRVRLAHEAREATLRAEAEKLRSELLSSVSHDLRTPLAAITGAGTTLRDGAALAPETRADLVETICEEAERLERLVSNLLEMTRLESGAVEPRREWVPLEEIVGGALTRLERRLASHPVSTDVPDDLPLLRVDPVLFEQLLVNLLENAAIHTPPGTPVQVSARREGDEVAIEVADRGPGIPPGDEERIFERFRRGSNATARGSGLGLAIARAVARVHGGALRAANRPGDGAAFRITVPAHEGAPPVPPVAPDRGGPP